MSHIATATAMAMTMVTVVTVVFVAAFLFGGSSLFFFQSWNRGTTVTTVTCVTEMKFDSACLTGARRHHHLDADNAQR